MANKLLVVTGLLAFVLVSAAVAAQVAFSHDAECTLREFTCTVERSDDIVRVTVETGAVSDVRVTVRGECVAEPVFAENGGDVVIEAACPYGQPRVTLDLTVLYDVDSKRSAATGRVVA